MKWDSARKPDVDTWNVIWLIEQIYELWLIWWKVNALEISYGSLYVRSWGRGMQNMWKWSEVYRRCSDVDPLTFKSDPRPFCDTLLERGVKKKWNREEKEKRKLPREEKGCILEYIWVWAIPLLGCIYGSYIPDHSNIPCVMSYRTELRCPLVGISSDLLMMGGWLINTEPASP